MMIRNLLQVDIISSLFGFAIGFLSFFVIMGWRQKQDKKHKLDLSKSRIEHAESLHWNPLVERRGLGDLLIKANHIALTVSDVGKSLSFYVDILGFQQIRRPTFDRHGAWLTMGNIELHLIKGIPVLPPVDNLQVGHIALETLHIDEVVSKLRELNVHIRQSLSVTNAHKSISKKKSHIIQYFINDPDGYYLELCNCDVLTEFSFNRNSFIDDIDYHEGIHNDTVFEIVQAASHWKMRSRAHSMEEMDDMLRNTPRATDIDEEKFDNLIKRRLIYGDIVQGFNDEDIKEALLQTNNIIPLTIIVLERKRGENKYFQPPSFIENGEVVEPESFILNRNDFNR
jgi:catechol 2,3-dioxygenase-like lactoylglutathione lyase family enzyme